jgi:hypothetical protein
LFAEILRGLAKTVAALPPSDAGHRDALREGARALYLALDTGEREKRGEPERTRKAKDTDAPMTPEEEVLLLHVME